MLHLTFEGEYANIPEMLQSSLVYYVQQGQMTGGFLDAVLRNDLFDAVTRADKESRRQLCSIVLWIERKTPGACHGSREKVEQWIKQKGMRGVL